MSEGGRSICRFLLLYLASVSLIYPDFVSFSSMPILSFPEISIASVNCNSLNMSALSSHQQKLKIYGITKLKTDFILLSDIRLSKSGLGTLTELSNLFLINPYCGYKFIHNSSKNARGVGILIKYDLPISVLAEARDENENILAIRLKLKGAEFILTCIYGPNKNCENFFNDLNNVFSNVSNLPIIVGGDWNCTPSGNPVKSNPDVINMSGLPNSSHTNKLSLLSEKFKLADIFRITYPNRKAFSYLPRVNVRKNRSRIDFILKSECLVDFAHNCDIIPHLQNSLFDHKATFVNFFKEKNNNQNASIANFILKDSLLGIVVKISAIECYLHHGVMDNGERRAKLAAIGRARSLLRIAGPDPLFPAPTVNGVQGGVRGGLTAEIELLVQDLNLPLLEQCELDIDYDIFLEFFVNCIRNDVISYQAYSSKIFHQEKNTLIREINEANLSSEPIFTLIAEKEKKLNDLCDMQMKNEFEKFKHFDIINSEKITPTFLKIIRGTDTNSTLSDVCDNNGLEFEDDISREKFIVDTFREIYKKPSSEPDDLSGCIEKFLGKSVLEHPIVQNSKLTPTEKAELERPFEITELDTAIKNANLKSASGQDGLNTRFIKQNWPVFRVPLFKYAVTCFNKGELSHSFRSAVVRLIPKKGDARKIKNWRPISLLSNLYKILSRALNTRLQKTTDRTMSRAQKGFTNSRYLQEVLINVTEFIGKCNASNANACVVSIDYAKAFDTLSINFVRECLKFFGFGSYFISMLDTVGKNRTASIILGGNRISEPFDLETGRPQGDILSPGTFNIGNQIMLFRLELDPKIASVYQHFLVPRPVFEPPNTNSHYNLKFNFESKRETDKGEGFADDTSALTIKSEENLANLSIILDEFADISGLKCNYDKTFIIPVGDLSNLSNFNPGKFKLATSFTLLGMAIDNKLENLLVNFDNVTKKMEKVKLFWDRLHLTLPGRIAVAKTFLLSLINHIGCFLTPSPQQVAKMQTLIDCFCLGKLSIAKDKLYMPPSEGGVGLININDFLIAQHAMWFKRAYISSRDNWRYDLCGLGYGNPFTVSNDDFSETSFPILHGLVKSFSTFRESFSNLHCNYKKAFILNNPLFRRSSDVEKTLDTKFFGGKLNPDLFNISKIKYCDLWDGDNFGQRLELNAKFGCNISMATYFQLRASIFHFLTVRKLPVELSPITMDLTGFFSSFKKGSRFCRNILAKCKTKVAEPIPFFRIIGIEPQDPMLVKKVLPLWCLTILPNQLREFIFKFFYNRLGLNARTVHFGGDTNLCTFCRLENNPSRPESFKHLFFDCPTVARIHNIFDTTVLQMVDENFNSRTARWAGFSTLPADNSFYRLLHLTVQYFIWKSKLRMSLPSENFILGETIALLDSFSTTGRRIFLGLDDYNCLLSRNWHILRERRW